MITRIVILGGVAALVVGCTSVEVVPGQYTILSKKDAWHALDQCSRPTPQAQVSDTWQPSSDDIQTLEAHLGRIGRMKAKLPCCVGCSVGDVNRFRRQYAGVVIDGRRFIYINAYPLDSHHFTFSTCDGGDYYWGALFDPQTGKFTDLAFNSEA